MAINLQRLGFRGILHEKEIQKVNGLYQICLRYKTSADLDLVMYAESRDEHKKAMCATNMKLDWWEMSLKTNCCHWHFHSTTFHRIFYSGEDWNTFPWLFWTLLQMK